MKISKDRLRILIAAGGTGGHLIPALQVAKCIEASPRIPKGRLRIEFVGVGRPVEAKILEPEGFVAHIIPSIGLRGKGISGLIDFLISAPQAFKASSRIIKSLRPDIVAGFGGYPSVFPIVAAKLAGIPTWIHEADSSAAWTAKFLSLFATKISAGFENISLPFGRKTIYSGHPIRAGTVPAVLPPDNFVPSKILIIGGSQGSKALDLALPNVIKALARSDIQIVHQARPDAAEQVARRYAELGLNAKVNKFITDMPQAFENTDLIISRSGAGSVTEISILNKPVIFVPLPKVSGPQLHNAKTMEKIGKALIVEEGDNFELRLEDAVAHLLTPKVYKEMMLKPFANKKVDAAKTIADGIIDIILK